MFSLQFSYYEDSDAREQVKDFSVPRFSKGAASLNEILMDEVKLVVSEN